MVRILNLVHEAVDVDVGRLRVHVQHEAVAVGQGGWGRGPAGVGRVRRCRLREGVWRRQQSEAVCDCGGGHGSVFLGDGLEVARHLLELEVPGAQSFVLSLEAVVLLCGDKWF